MHVLGQPRSVGFRRKAWCSLRSEPADATIVVNVLTLNGEPWWDRTTDPLIKRSIRAFLSGLLGLAPSLVVPAISPPALHVRPFDPCPTYDELGQPMMS